MNKIRGTKIKVFAALGEKFLPIYGFIWNRKKKNFISIGVEGHKGIEIDAVSVNSRKVHFYLTARYKYKVFN